jgi:hypothetical protein
MTAGQRGPGMTGRLWVARDSARVRARNLWWRITGAATRSELDDMGDELDALTRELDETVRIVLKLGRVVGQLLEDEAGPEPRPGLRLAGDFRQRRTAARNGRMTP